MFNEKKTNELIKKLSSDLLEKTIEFVNSENGFNYTSIKDDLNIILSGHITSIFDFMNFISEISRDKKLKDSINNIKNKFIESFPFHIEIRDIEEKNDESNA